MSNPPKADRRPHVHLEHGVEREDPYFWLRERENPDVLAHLKAENAWTDRQIAHLSPLEQRLYEEMVGRIQEDDDSAPVPHGPWEYFHRTFEGKSYSAFCRRKRGDATATVQTLLDENELAEGHEFTSVSMISVSPDHRQLAYAIDHDGNEIYEIRFLDLETGETLDDRIADAAPSFAWSADCRTVYWLEMDDAQRNYRLHRKTLGEPDSDAVLFQEDDERFSLSIYLERDQSSVVLYVASNVTTELHLLDAHDPAASLVMVHPRQHEIRYEIEPQGDTIWIATNAEVGPDGTLRPDAPNRRLLRTTRDKLGAAHWEPVLPHRDDVQIVGLTAFARHLVLLERTDGQLQIRIQASDGSSDTVLDMPEAVSTVSLASNPEFESEWLRFRYTSMTTPASVFRVHLDRHDRELVKQTPVPTYDPSRYETERRTAVAPDGTVVPMSLVRRRDVTPSASTPLLVYGYGSYGITNLPMFRATRVSLLDRGLVFVIAHVRGSSFYGRKWYETGKLAHKTNTFTDFIACIEGLHADGIGTPETTSILGGSAGGLLVGAVINRAPQLMKAAVAAVPFVDVVTTMLDASLPLTAREWDEWGNPQEREAFDRMLTYSPYDNVTAQDYPNLFVLAGLNDSRVQYWEPAKWVARLRDRATAGEILLRTNMGAGHTGPSGRYGYLREQAKEFAWILDQLGATERLEG
ncbi:MAG: S9 family peptidase [Myxococcota bacterium]